MSYLKGTGSVTTEKYIVNIRVEQLLGNRDIDEHQCLENIKKFCKYSGRCDDQQQYIAIFRVDMISTTKGNTCNRTMSIIMSLPVNIHSA